MKTQTLASLVFLSFALTSHAVERWSVFELALDGPESGNPYLDVQWSATFTQGKRKITVPGFWDGGGTYKVRFCPPTAGEWRYQTKSATPELNGKTGTFTATAPTGNNHGPIEIFDTFYLRYADGAPYHQFGTTCYVWTHQTRELQEQTLKTLAGSPFNKIRFCTFPKSYTYNKNEPEFFAFLKKADGTFDFARPDPAFWRHFEGRILDLQKLGIEADLILWHPYDRWGFAEMGKENDDRYLRYCIARLGAYRNVWWSLANEYDLMSPGAMKNHRGDKSLADWDRFFSILDKEDPFARLRSIHNCRGFYDHTKAWVHHASLQTSDMAKGVVFRRQFNKPVIYDECKYEGNVPQGWGNLTGREMTQRFWLGTLSGCYVGHGETFLDPQDILWWAKGGLLHGQSPQRIAWLKDFMKQCPPFHQLQPLGDEKGRYLLAKPGEFYLLYCTSTRPQTLKLEGTRPYKVDIIDPWEMTITLLGTAPAGEYTLTEPKADRAYRFVPYAAGERLRPDAKISASATEGLPPLSVRFTGEGGARVRWDFGDGAASEDRNPTHIFEKPGFYTVTLTVSDTEGGKAQASLRVAADRNVNEPIVRVGVARDEQPALQLEGTARRNADGSLRFPEGAPWGRAQSGIVEDLRGLRSFTVCGWLKPESLKTGNGGNRVLFCLNRDHSGIDLVALADGRMRLAVNQWPDAVRCDSTPGKLAIGKWTFFAVSYDATEAKENVSWYFSPPCDAPQAAQVALDCRATYNAGAVGADIGPLTIGNFNATMKAFGMDRQFRGEIHNLRLLGSRMSRRGALSLDALGRLAAAVGAPADAFQPAARPVYALERNAGTGRFAVRGTKIFDPEGREFVPLGVNLNGSNSFRPSDTAAHAKPSSRLNQRG